MSPLPWISRLSPAKPLNISLEAMFIPSLVLLQEDSLCRSPLSETRKGSNSHSFLCRDITPQDITPIY